MSPRIRLEDAIYYSTRDTIAYPSNTLITGVRRAIQLYLAHNPEGVYAKFSEPMLALQLFASDTDSRILKQWDVGAIQIIGAGILAGLDVSVYDKPYFNAKQMLVIYNGLRYGCDVSVYAHPTFTGRQMYYLLEALLSGVDVSDIANPQYDEELLDILCAGKKAGLDISKMLDPTLSRDVVCAIYKTLLCDKYRSA